MPTRIVRQVRLLAALTVALPLSATAVDFVDGKQPNVKQVALGKLLFHDKLLSGNMNTSCASCHHALADTGDGLSLPIGEGGRGLGVTRDTGSGAAAVVERVPRNAPPVFMLGSTEVTAMFHDGRIEFDPSFPSGFASPAGDDLPEGLDTIVAVQAMFPVTSPTEMAGQGNESLIAAAAAVEDLTGVWQLLAERLQSVPEYVNLFVDAFDDIGGAADITYVHAANAIGAFEIDAWRADNSPWDAFKGGNSRELNKHEKHGFKLFFGKAGCSGCHSGDTFSDMQYHAIAMPQIGPGKGDGYDGHEDFGRFRVTGDERDMFAFRTPPLRNVALTAPYGHSGAYDTLEDVVRHHLDPQAALWEYHDQNACRSKPVMPARDDLDAIDCAVMDDAIRVQAIADAAADYRPVKLKEKDIGDLLAFLNALTDKGNIDLRRDVPKSVPSGLTLAE